MWKEIKSDESDKSQSQMWDWNKNPELIGTLQSIKRNVGMHKSNIYTVITPQKEKAEFWGNTNIDQALSNQAPGIKVKIVSQGKTLNRNTGRYFNKFSIFIDDGTINEPEEVIDINDIKF